MGVDLIRIRDGKVTAFVRLIRDEVHMLRYQLGCPLELPDIGDFERERPSTTSSGNAAAAPDSR
jgi:hypothetical protein